MSLYFDCAINSGSSSGNIHINTTWHTSHALLAVRLGCHYPFPMTIIIIDRWGPTRRRGAAMSPCTLTMASQRRTSASPRTPRPRSPPPPGTPPGTVLSRIVKFNQIPNIFWKCFNYWIPNSFSSWKRMEDCNFNNSNCIRFLENEWLWIVCLTICDNTDQEGVGCRLGEWGAVPLLWPQQHLLRGADSALRLHRAPGVESGRLQAHLWWRSRQRSGLESWQSRPTQHRVPSRTQGSPLANGVQKCTEVRPAYCLPCFTDCVQLWARSGHVESGQGGRGGRREGAGSLLLLETQNWSPRRPWPRGGSGEHQLLRGLCVRGDLLSQRERQLHGGAPGWRGHQVSVATNSKIPPNTEYFWFMKLCWLSTEYHPFMKNVQIPNSAIRTLLLKVRE